MMIWGSPRFRKRPAFPLFHQPVLTCSPSKKAAAPLASTKAREGAPGAAPRTGGSLLEEVKLGKTMGSNGDFMEIWSDLMGKTMENRWKTIISTHFYHYNTIGMITHILPPKFGKFAFGEDTISGKLFGRCGSVKMIYKWWCFHIVCVSLLEGTPFGRQWG